MGRFERLRWLVALVERLFDSVAERVPAWLKPFVLDTKARVADGIVDIMVGLILVGSMGLSAWNFGAANFSQADAVVRVMVGTVVPLMAGVGVLLVFLNQRKRGG
jgi:hypothetical protein